MVGEIATLVIEGAEFATVATGDATAVPLAPPSEAVTLTYTVSPREKYVTPDNDDPVAATKLPFTYQAYDSVRVSPSTSAETTVVEMVALVVGAYVDNATDVTVGAVLEIVTVFDETADPAVVPSLGVAEQYTAWFLAK